MHSFKGPSGAVFNFNSDMSGQVRVRDDGRFGFERAVEVDGRDLLAFFGHLERSWADDIADDTDSKPLPVGRLPLTTRRQVQIRALVDKTHGDDAGYVVAIEDLLAEVERLKAAIGLAAPVLDALAKHTDSQLEDESEGGGYFSLVAEAVLAMRRAR